MKRWLIRSAVIVVVWVAGAWCALSGPAYVQTHPIIKHPQGTDVLVNPWRNLVAATTGWNSLVIFLALVAITLMVMYVGKKKK